jgi:hypothetical protein
MLIAEVTSAVQLTSEHIMWLSALATAGLVIMWAIFWFVVRRTEESAAHILLSPAFFKSISVMGIIAATVVLSLAGRLDGNVTGAILSGIVGYVLGAMTGREKQTNDRERDNAGVLRGNEGPSEHQPDAPSEDRSE